jgi:hypothetical protein
VCCLCLYMECYFCWRVYPLSVFFVCKHCVLFVFIHGVLFLLTCLYVKCFLCVQTLCAVLCIHTWSGIFHGHVVFHWRVFFIECRILCIWVLSLMPRLRNKILSLCFYLDYCFGLCVQHYLFSTCLYKLILESRVILYVFWLV